MSINQISSNSNQGVTLDASKTSKLHDLNNDEKLVKNDAAPQEEISKKKIKDIVESMNKFVIPAKTSIQFELHEDLKEYYVKVVNQQTQEIIREIPSKKILDIYASMIGLIVDKKI